MRSLYRVVTVLIVAALPGFATSPVQASPAPHEVLQSLADDALTLLTDQKMTDTDRQQAFRSLLQEGFDIDAVSRFVLGRYWRQATPQERESFTILFEDYIVATYAVRLGHYDREMFQVTGSRVLDDEDRVLVLSEIRPPNGPGIKVDWRMHRIDSGWRITDIVVEGVSMAVAQRAEFASVIRSQGGVSGLLIKLEAKTRHLGTRRYADTAQPTTH